MIGGNYSPKGDQEESKFTEQRFFEVNREERHYCALLAHALLSSKPARTSFTEMINSRCKINFSSDSLEVHLEAAVLRDYWNALGNSKKYPLETNQRRRQVLKGIIKHMGYSIDIIDNNPFFWTKGINGDGSKLWSPGHWDEKAIKAAPLPNLKKIKWAFNAKPDIMMISNEHVLLIEAKIESPEGKYDKFGTGQKQIQKLIADLMKQFIPTFQNTTIKNILLALKSPNEDEWPYHITWEDVIDILKTTHLDAFTQECFKQLQTQYYSNANNH